MKRKTLIFLCDNYPLAAREFFVDDEMRVIAPLFERVVVYTASERNGSDYNHYIPENAEILSFSRQTLEARKYTSLFQVFSRVVLSELFFMMKTVPVRQWFSAVKVLYIDFHRAQNIKKDIIDLCAKKKLQVEDCLFYSYWHDYKALALALLRKESTCACIARAHGWDNFANRHVPKYLPFKSYIIKTLSQTYTISQVGKDYFADYIGHSVDGFVTVSRLGKFNNRSVLYEKDTTGFVICSCSDIRADKRIDKIIDVISVLQIPHVMWVHIGDDNLRTKIEQYAQEKLPAGSYTFLGMIPNAAILDYYSSQYIDLFINLSTSEGIPVSIMEALSAGIPVLATKVGGTPEIVNDTNGFLVEENFRVEDVARVIDNYLSQPASVHQQYRHNAYNFWIEHFEAEKNYSIFGKDIVSRS